LPLGTFKHRLEVQVPMDKRELMRSLNERISQTLFWISTYISSNKCLRSFDSLSGW
jgi:hypothetical protein